MSEIVKYNNNEIYVNSDLKTIIPPNLPISRKNREIYLSGKNNLQINSIKDKNTVVNKIHEFVNLTIMDKGINIPIEEIQYLKTRVTDDIIRNYSNFTLEDIRLAFYYGVRGEIGKGDYYGINPVTFNDWLRGYRLELKANANKEVMRFLPKKKKKNISKKDYNNSLSAMVNNVFIKYRDSGVYNFTDYGCVVYKFLDETINVLNLSVKTKNELISKSRVIFKSKIANKNRYKGKFDKIDLNLALKEIQNESNTTYENSIISGAKQLAIDLYIKDCVVNKIDLSEILKIEISKINYKNNKMEKAP